MPHNLQHHNEIRMQRHHKLNTIVSELILLSNCPYLCHCTYHQSELLSNYNTVDLVIQAKDVVRLRRILIPFQSTKRKFKISERYIALANINVRLIVNYCIRMADCHFQTMETGCSMWFLFLVLFLIQSPQPSW